MEVGANMLGCVDSALILCLKKDKRIMKDKTNDKNNQQDKIKAKKRGKTNPQRANRSQTKIIQVKRKNDHQ